MKNRRLLSVAAFGALGASLGVSSACSSSSPPGFGGPDNGGSSNNGNTNGNATSSSSSSGTSSGTSSQGTVYTNTGSSSSAGGGSNNTGTGASTSTGTASSSTSGTATGSSSAGTSASGASSATGTGTGTVTTGGATGCGTVTTCSAPIATDALKFNSSCYQSTVGVGGYAYVSLDKGGSTGCVDSTAFCGSGMLVAAGPMYYFGAPIGIAVGQPSGAMASAGVAPKATGLTWGLSAGAILPYGLQITITGGDGMLYCYRPAVTTTSGTTPWANFTVNCYDTPPGAAFAPATQITQIQFQAITGAAAGAWGFCVQSGLAF